MWSVALLTILPPLEASPAPTFRGHAAPAFDRSAQAACVTTPAPLPLRAPVIVPAPPLAAARVPADRSDALPDVATAAGVLPLILETVGLGYVPLKSPPA